MNQVKPPDGPHVLTGTGMDPNHNFDARGPLGVLDPGTVDEIHFAWDEVNNRYVFGDWLLYFYDEPPAYLLVNLATLQVETGHWT